MKQTSIITIRCVLGLILSLCAQLSVHGQNNPITGSAYRFVGDWGNKDFMFGGNTRISIRLEGDRIVVHMWGRCHPRECDWGEAPAITQGTDTQSLLVTWNQGFAFRTQELKLLSDGSLESTIHTHFTDQSGRGDYDARDNFVKGLVHDWNDPTSGADRLTPRVQHQQEPQTNTCTGSNTATQGKLAAEGPSAERRHWEAQIPPGSETDPIALNIALGQTDIPNRDIVERLRGCYEITPHSFAGLTPKVTNDGIFIVAVRRDPERWVPPDMAGKGPFYLVKSGAVYYALTAHNLARLFSPIDKKAEVLPYLRVYESLFGNPFAEVVAAGAQKDSSEKGAEPPHFTEVAELNDGFRVRLVTYTVVHICAFFEKTIHLGRDGVVEVEQPESILKKLGEGAVF